MAHPVEYSCQPDYLHSDDDLNSYGHSESEPFTQKSKEISSDADGYYHDSHDENNPNFTRHLTISSTKPLLLAKPEKPTKKDVLKGSVTLPRAPSTKVKKNLGVLFCFDDDGLILVMDPGSWILRLVRSIIIFLFPLLITGI